MKSTHGAGRSRIRSDAPRVHQLKNVPYKAGNVKVADIRKAVNAVVKERLAAEAARHAIDPSK